MNHTPKNLYFTLVAIDPSDGSVIRYFDAMHWDVFRPDEGKAKTSGGAVAYNTNSVFHVVPVTGTSDRQTAGIRLFGFNRTTLEHEWSTPIDWTSEDTGFDVYMHCDDSYLWVAMKGRIYSFDALDGSQIATIIDLNLTDHANLVSGSVDGRVCIGGRIEYDHNLSSTQTSSLSPVQWRNGVEYGGNFMFPVQQNTNVDMRYYYVSKSALNSPTLALEETFLFSSVYDVIAYNGSYFMTSAVSKCYTTGGSEAWSEGEGSYTYSGAAYWDDSYVWLVAFSSGRLHRFTWASSGSQTAGMYINYGFAEHNLSEPFAIYPNETRRVLRVENDATRGLFYGGRGGASIGISAASNDVADSPVTSAEWSRNWTYVLNAGASPQYSVVDVNYDSVYDRVYFAVIREEYTK